MKTKGMTLIEVLITMGLATIVGMILVMIMVNSAGLFYKESSNVQQGLNSNDALSNVLAAVRQAAAVVSSYSSGGDTYTSGLTQLVLKLPAEDSSKNIIANTFDFFVYYLDQNKLRFKTFPDAQSNRKPQNQIFSTSTDSLNFQYFDSANPPNQVSPTSATKIRVTISLKQKSGGIYQTNIATSEASLRND